MTAPDEPWYISAFGADYARRYAHRDTREADAAVAALKAWVTFRERHVLDLCCGTGRHIPALLGAGAARVTGVDLSAPLLAQAAERLEAEGDRVTLIQADMRDLPLPAASVDVAVSFFTSFGYFPDEADDRRVVDGVARVLKPGGDYVLDFFDRDHVLENLVARDDRADPDVPGALLVAHRWYDPTTDRVEKRVHRRPADAPADTPVDDEPVATESVRAYSADALCALVEASGFVVRQVLGDYNGTPHTELRHPPRAIVIARKTE